MKHIGLGLLLLLSTSYTLADTLMVEVEVINQQHSVVKTWVVEGDFWETSTEAQDNSIKVSLWRNDFELETYFVANPVSAHTPLMQDGSEATHEAFEVETTIYHLRLPVIQNATHLTIVEGDFSRDQNTPSLQQDTTLLNYRF